MTPTSSTQGIGDFGPTPWDDDVLDREKTGRPRCIGCAKFLKVDATWNQCASCDIREPEER